MADKRVHVVQWEPLTSSKHDPSNPHAVAGTCYTASIVYAGLGIFTALQVGGFLKDLWGLGAKVISSLSCTREQREVVTFTYDVTSGRFHVHPDFLPNIHNPY